MVSVTALIDKLTEIERSIGAESNSTIRTQVIEAQDCALLIQREIVGILRGERVTIISQDRLASQGCFAAILRGSGSFIFRPGSRAGLRVSINSITYPPVVQLASYVKSSDSVLSC